VDHVHSVEAASSAAACFPDEALAALEPLDEEFFSYPYDLTASLFAHVSWREEAFGKVAITLVEGVRV
jgi:hypothetical protein